MKRLRPEIVRRLLAGAVLVALALGITSGRAKADPEFLSLCTRSPLCASGVTDFEQGSDYPRGGFLEPDGVNIAPVGSGSQKLNNYAFSFSGSNFLWSPGGGTFGQVFTIAVWVYPTQLGGASQKQILLSEDGDNAYGNALYLQNLGGLLKAVIDIRDGIDPKNGTHVTATWGSDISRNAWHLILARVRPKWDYNSATNDGVLDISVDNGAFVTTAVTKPLNSGGGRLFLGKTNTKGSENYYTGYMDQLVVSGLRITDEQAGQLWNGGAGLQYPFITGNSAHSTPTSHWRFDRVNTGAGALRDDAAGYNDASVAGGTVAGGTSGPFGYSADFTAGFASVAAPIIDPASLGPMAWYKADAIGGLADGDAVGTWIDSGGFGYDVTQATGANKPSYRAGILNGKPVVRFDGTNDFLSGTLASFTGGTVFAVAKHAGGATNAVWRLGDTSQNHHWQSFTTTGTALSSNHHDGSADSVTKSGLTSGTWYIGTWTADGVNVCVGASDTRTTGLSCVASGAGTAKTAFSVGARATTTPDLYLNGDVAEVILFTTNLTEAQRKSIELYLADKYAISLPYQSDAVGHQNIQTDGRPFTIEGWFKVSSTGAVQGLVANRNGTNGWKVYTNGAGASNRVALTWGNGSADTATITNGTTNIAAGTWYYFAARFDGTTFKIRVNNDTDVTSTTSPYPTNAPYFYFGTTDDGTSNKLTGSLSSVSWHKGLSLSDSEVTAHYNSGAGRECCPIK